MPAEVGAPRGARRAEAEAEQVGAPREGEYVVHLPAFEGPLDLLLHLIQKHELDILDIPVSFITEWTGQDLALGLSIAPFKNIPLTITPALRDVAGAGDGARFVVGTGMAFKF